MHTTLSFNRFQSMLMKIAFGAKICDGGCCSAPERLREKVLTLSPSKSIRENLVYVIQACHEEIGRGHVCQIFVDMTFQLEALHQDLFGCEPDLEYRPAILIESDNGSFCDLGVCGLSASARSTAPRAHAL
ncbi:hypothetical protein [Rhodospira trueperi]|uniref:Uncharacterized protein n=1 Tax=Rhodospira trueperi TaxID=69960 RepID=A0A1G7AQW4_9PROT|nr:hypothetical protein [Rhodospira trueperi]SDE17284.1 hypothetical protein SAMN05421720_10455 [Rhodospira trueperi]